MKGFVYLIYDEDRDLYKIGVTTNTIDKRLKKLQTGNASELSIRDFHESDYIFRMETLLHNHFKNKRILNEWFSLSYDDVKNFKSLCNGFEDTIKALSINPFFAKNLR